MVFSKFSLCCIAQCPTFRLVGPSFVRPASEISKGCLGHLSSFSLSVFVYIQTQDNSAELNIAVYFIPLDFFLYKFMHFNSLFLDSFNLLYIIFVLKFPLMVIIASHFTHILSLGYFYLENKIR